LNALLFGEEGFRGNEASYYDPRNSYLNQVLDRRLGLPITLALIYVEVGRRARLPLSGKPAQRPTSITTSDSVIGMPSRRSSTWFK